MTVAVVIAVALIASTALAAQAFGSDAPQYVTATVARHDVDALLSGVATIEPVSQATVAFPVAGTVAAVDVKLGDTVAIGQTLASLDTQSLTDALHQKESTLAQAELTLSKALNGEAVGGTSSGAGGSGAFKTASLTTDAKGSTRIVLTAASASSGSGDAELVAAQLAVLSAQKNVDAALSDANEALDAATTVCGAAGVTTSGTPTTSTTTPTTAALTACQTATKTVLTAQTAVSTTQTALASASKTLDDLLTRRATASSGSSGSTSNAGSTTSGSPASGSGQTGAASAASSSPSSADLVAFQKAVDAAAAEVAVAEQAVAQATIASPIAGTVVGVNVAVGDSVSAGSTTQNIIVVGDGGFEAVTTVGVTKLPAIKVGQKAAVIPDGSRSRLDGTVVSISGTPDSSASTTSYQVVVTLSTHGATQAAANGLHNGSTGSVAIVTKRADAVLAVPTSAVTTTGTRHRVTVLDGSTTERVFVEVGVVGDTWTEITSGLDAGQAVVLANLDEPLPGSATASSSSTSNQDGPTGGFPPGRFSGGAFPGGAPGGPG